MKALTLKQPWATLVAIGAKRIETRSRRTFYRGPLAIHAAKGFPRHARDFYYAMVAEQFGIAIEDLPLGCIVATGTLSACLSTEQIHRDRIASGLTTQEESFGEYSPRRFGWFLEDMVALAEPIPVLGMLGLWECKFVERALKAGK